MDTITLDYAIEEFTELASTVITEFPPKNSPPKYWIAYGLLVVIAGFQFFKNVIFKKKIIVIQKELKKKKDV